MKKKLISLPIALGVAMTAFGTALPAAAAESEWPTTKPYIEYVGGQYTDINGVEVDEQRPLIKVSWDVTVPNGTLRVLDSNDETICEGSYTDEFWSLGYMYACTPTADLPYGETDIRAVIESDDGLESSQPSDVMSVFVSIPNPTISVHSYDPVTKNVVVRGKAPKADVVRVYADDPQSAIDGTLAADGTWTATLSGVETESVIHVVASRGALHKGAEVYLPDLSTPDAPKATGRVGGGFAFIDITDAKANEVYTVVNQRGSFVAGGSGQSGASTTITIRDPEHEAHYFVTTTRGMLNSEATEVVINTGTGEATPPAPMVDEPSISTSRVSIPVSGSPNAIVSIEDADGKVVAVKSLGSRGTTQVAFALPAGRVAGTAVYMVTQSTPEATSEPTRLRL